jgi:hypothetical protein
MKRMLMVSVLAMVAAAGSASAGPVTADDLLKAQDNSKEWLTYGRDYRNWRYSPLDKITPETASKLAPVWAMSTGGQFGGLEGTPLFRDGISTSPPITRAPSPSTPNPATFFGVSNPNMATGSTPCCAAAPSTAAWRSPATL